MNSPKTVVAPCTIILILFFIVAVPFLPLLISRHWDWREAWVNAILYILGFAISRALAARRHPDLLVERARYLSHADAKSWDMLYLPWLSLGAA